MKAKSSGFIGPCLIFYNNMLKATNCGLFYAIIQNAASVLKTSFMKRILFMLIPVVIMALAFRPVTSFTVSGKIIDDKGSPVAGVTVMVKGTNIATSSTQDGTYAITVNDKNATLVFSSVGYSTQSVKIKGRTAINVSLKSAVAELQEVVVTGYSTQRKMSMTGSVSTISSEQIRSSRVPNYNLSSNSPGFQNNNNYIMPDSDNDGVFDVFDTENYDHISENKFLKATDNPLSTFSIDVDAASYSNVRRYLNQGQLPPAGAVRIEEMINYFHYDYPQPNNDQPFSINTEISDAPWNKNHKLVLIGLQGKKIPTENLPASNLVFLIDVSGSMNDAQ